MTWKRVVSAIVSLVIIVGIFYFVIPLIADYDEVFATISAMTTSEITSLVLIGLWNLVTYWFVIVAALPGLRLREAAVVNQASTAVSNTLPAGGALGVGLTLAMLTSWGFTIAAITYLLPIPLGIASYIIWRVNNSWRMTYEERAQLAGDAYDVEVAPAA